MQQEGPSAQHQPLPSSTQKKTITTPAVEKYQNSNRQTGVNAVSIYNSNPKQVSSVIEKKYNFPASVPKSSSISSKGLHQSSQSSTDLKKNQFDLPYSSTASAFLDKIASSSSSHHHQSNRHSAHYHRSHAHNSHRAFGSKISHQESNDSFKKSKTAVTSRNSTVTPLHNNQAAPSSSSRNINGSNKGLSYHNRQCTYLNTKKTQQILLVINRLSSSSSGSLSSSDAIFKKYLHQQRPPYKLRQYDYACYYDGSGDSELAQLDENQDLDYNETNNEYLQQQITIASHNQRNLQYAQEMRLQNSTKNKPAQHYSKQILSENIKQNHNIKVVPKLLCQNKSKFAQQQQLSYYQQSQFSLESEQDSSFQKKSKQIKKKAKRKSKQSQNTINEIKDKSIQKKILVNQNRIQSNSQTLNQNFLQSKNEVKGQKISHKQLSIKNQIKEKIGQLDDILSQESDGFSSIINRNEDQFMGSKDLRQES